MFDHLRNRRYHYFQSKFYFIQGFIEECIKSTQEHILFPAVKALKPFLRTYHTLQDEKYIKNFIHQAKATQTLSRCYTLTLSKLSKDIYIHHVPLSLFSSKKFLK